MFSSAAHADDTNVVIPTARGTNYALYPATTGVFLRLDTRDGTMQAIVPSNPKKNRMLNSEPLAHDNRSGRFELYPGVNGLWEWLLFDTVTGDIWLLRWDAKKNILSKLPVAEE